MMQRFGISISSAMMSADLIARASATKAEVTKGSDFFPELIGMPD